MKNNIKELQKKRRSVQLTSLLFLNLDLVSLLKGEISKFKTKTLCLPTLNCTSCPAAIWSCPIGIIQNSVTSFREKLSLAAASPLVLYLGSFVVFGFVAGRWACGWLCPFGYLQDVLFKVPVKKIRLPANSHKIRYIVFALFLFLLPLFLIDSMGYVVPWFCKWACPAGTLESWIPMAMSKPDLFSGLKSVFFWKVVILLSTMAMIMFSRRAFCHLACPLGLLLGFFNRLSLFKLKVNYESCKHCNACARNCPFGLEIYNDPNSPLCIRCLSCKEICPSHCVQFKFDVNFLQKSRNKESDQPPGSEV